MTRELYLSIVLDRAAGKPVIMASAAGGMDIEEVAAKTPEKIVTRLHRAGRRHRAVRGAPARRSRIGLDGAAGEQVRQAR